MRWVSVQHLNPHDQAMLVEKGQEEVKQVCKALLVLLERGAKHAVIKHALKSKVVPPSRRLKAVRLNCLLSEAVSPVLLKPSHYFWDMRMHQISPFELAQFRILISSRFIAPHGETTHKLLLSARLPNQFLTGWRHRWNSDLRLSYNVQMDETRRSLAAFQQCYDTALDEHSFGLEMWEKRLAETRPKLVSATSAYHVIEQKKLDVSDLELPPQAAEVSSLSQASHCSCLRILFQAYTVIAQISVVYSNACQSWWHN